jgi:hypothetical protein
MRGQLLRLAPLLIVGLCGSAAGRAQTPPPATPAEPASATTLTATVRAVDAGTRTVKVLTGVGPALRVVTLACDERAAVKSEAGELPLYQLKAGDLVRVRYSRGPAGDTATAIELLQWPRSGGVR